MYWIAPQGEKDIFTIGSKYGSNDPCSAAMYCKARGWVIHYLWVIKSYEEWHAHILAPSSCCTECTYCLFSHSNSLPLIIVITSPLDPKTGFLWRRLRSWHPLLRTGTSFSSLLPNNLLEISDDGSNDSEAILNTQLFCTIRYLLCGLLQWLLMWNKVRLQLSVLFVPFTKYMME